GVRNRLGACEGIRCPIDGAESVRNNALWLSGQPRIVRASASLTKIGSATAAIIAIGPDANEAIPALIEQIRKRDTAVLNALLGEVSNRADKKRLMGPLSRMLSGVDPDIRRKLSDALGESP